MAHPIPALPRFGLGTAFGLMFAVLALEAIATWLLGKLYFLGIQFGFYDCGADRPGFEATLLIAAKIVACALVAGFVLNRSGESWRHLGHAGFAPTILVLGFVPIVAALTIFVSEIDNLIRVLFGADGLGGWNIGPSLEAIISDSWQGIALAVVVGPLAEEIVFRGLILRGLLGRWRPGTAIAASAALFALTHLNPAQLPIAFTLGLILGWVYVRTQSLGLCFAGHAINNATAFLLGGALPFEVDNFNRVTGSAQAGFHPWWFDVTGVALLAAGWWLLHRFAPPPPPWRAPVPAEPPSPAPAEPPLLRPEVAWASCPCPGNLSKPTGGTQPSPETTAGTPPMPRPNMGETPMPRANPQTSAAVNAAGKALGAEPPLLDAGVHMSTELSQLVTSLGQRARAASLALATASTAEKNAALEKLADLIDASHFELLAANQRDLLSPEASALSPAGRERLSLDDRKLLQLAKSVREVVALPDPVGELLEETTRPNGLRIRKVRVPIGVIAIIFEARPNVTIDCAVLCLKSGNASILRGGKECFHTNMALAALITQALGVAGLPGDSVQLVPTTDRAALNTLLTLDSHIHCVIPRGGESLIRYVAEHSTIPVIKHYKGVCFVYVDAAADLAMAEAITINAKTSRPGVCNAAEQLLVHRGVAGQFLPAAGRALAARNVQLRCDPASAAILQKAGVPATAATPADYTTEFLDTILAVRIVDSLDTAIATINRDSSNHSDAIVTGDDKAARRFLSEIDSATVYWNASTRFTDGYEFGYGAEIGISTDRLHARGPMGLRELCTHKFLIEGTGQVRE